MKNKSWFPLFFIIVLFLSFPLGSYAQSNGQGLISDDEVNEIAKQLYCPICENIPLDVCGTQACVQWRELIREKLTEGWSEKEIKDYFVLHYGDRVLAEPPPRGLNLLIYLVPPTAFIIGVIILLRGLKPRSVGKDMDEKNATKSITIEDKLIPGKENEQTRSNNDD